MLQFRWLILAAAAFPSAVLLLVGCNRGPAPIQVPDFDPQTASQQALDIYDKDHNSELSKEELAACPAILASLAAYDTDKNGSVSAEEIEARLTPLRNSGVGLTQLVIEVRMNGRPLQGANVRLLPEPYFGPNIKSADGKTSRRGIAVMDIRDDDAPAGEKGLTGVHYGTYKIEVTHPTFAIPEKYNTATTLGYETQRGSPDYRIELSR
jgi:hypothetical protein